MTSLPGMLCGGAAAPAPAAAAAPSPVAPARAPPPPLRVGSEDGVGRAMTPLANALGGARMNDTPPTKRAGTTEAPMEDASPSKMRGFGDGASPLRRGRSFSLGGPESAAAAAVQEAD